MYNCTKWYSTLLPSSSHYWELGFDLTSFKEFKESVYNCLGRIMGALPPPGNVRGGVAFFEYKTRQERQTCVQSTEKLLSALQSYGHSLGKSSHFFSGDPDKHVHDCMTANDIPPCCGAVIRGNTSRWEASSVSDAGYLLLYRNH